MTNILLHLPFSRFREFSDYARSARLNLELYFGAETLDTVNDDELREAVAYLDYSPRMVFHAPFMDLSPGAVDPDIRKVTLRRFRQVSRAAKIFRPETIVFHSGYEKWKYALETRIWLEQSVKTWNAVLSETVDEGCRLAIENIFEDTPDNLVQLMEAMNNSRMGLCFDTGHFNLFSSISLEEWLDRCSKHICHLHVHDNDRSADLHAPPGSGTFPFKELFERLAPRTPTMTLEAHCREDAVIGLERLKYLLGQVKK